MFTLMVGVFLILVVSMHLYGVNSNSYYRRRNRPFTINIAGDSGAGKRKVAPKPYIVMCGLHSLYLPQMRQVLDLKIYLDTDEALRCYWKMGRDQDDRGHTAAKVMAQIEQRRDDAEKYILPQKQYADLVTHYFDKGLSKT